MVTQQAAQQGTHVQAHACTQAHARTHMHSGTCTHAHAHTQTHTHTHIGNVIATCTLKARSDVYTCGLEADALHEVSSAVALVEDKTPINPNITPVQFPAFEDCG